MSENAFPVKEIDAFVKKEFSDRERRKKFVFLGLNHDDWKIEQPRQVLIIFDLNKLVAGCVRVGSSCDSL